MTGSCGCGGRLTRTCRGVRRPSLRSPGSSKKRRNGRDDSRLCRLGSPRHNYNGQVKIFLSLLLATSFACAQSRAIVLRAARMFDGVSDRLVSPGVIVVLGDKIRGVGPNAEIPANSEIIDLGDATLLPGFIDAHTHLTDFYNPDTRQQELDGLKWSPPERALRASVNARVTLMAGFTTVRDVGSGDFVDVALRNAIRAGAVPGPRMLVAVNAIGATGGHCDGGAGFQHGLFGHETNIEEGVANGAEQMRAAVRFNIKYGADVIKTCATGGVLSPTDDVDTPQLTQAELDALVDEAHALRRKTAAHAHGAEGAKRAIRAGIDSIEHGSFLDDEALEMMKARGTYYVPTQLAVQGLRETLEKGYFPPLIATKARLGDGIARHHCAEGYSKRSQGRAGHRCCGLSSRAQRGRVRLSGQERHEAD